MLFRIRHRTSYRFSRDVFLEPHVVRLRPRCDPFQKLLDHSMKVLPAPAGRSDGVDAEGNQAAFLWFDGMTRDLAILSESSVETLRPDPFDYFITHPEALGIPVSYGEADSEVLAPYLKKRGTRGVLDLARDLREKVGQQTLSYLNELTTTLYRDWNVIVREEGDPLDPEETLKCKEVSCRDLTVLFMEACREMGIASRFVSGYQEGDRDQVERFMHAWPEIYLPGAGWRGYDPTHGLVVADRHVALASAADPRSASPTLGTFRGTGTTSTMEIHLEIEIDKDRDS